MIPKRIYSDHDFGGVGTVVDLREPVESGDAATKQYVDTRPAQAAPRYTFVQVSAASAWIVNHNLGSAPAGVSVRTPGGVEVDAAVIHTSPNQLIIQFAAAQSGTVIVL